MMLRQLLARAPLRTCTPLALRAYTTQAPAKLPDIDASKLTITRTQTPKALMKPEELVFGHNFTGTLSNRLRCFYFSSQLIALHICNSNINNCLLL